LRLETKAQMDAPQGLPRSDRSLLQLALNDFMRTSPPLSHGELLHLKRWNTPTIYNGWEQITKHDAAADAFNLEEVRDFMPQMGDARRPGAAAGHRGGQRAGLPRRRAAERGQSVKSMIHRT
jgi:hypothetical protein